MESLPPKRIPDRLRGYTSAIQKISQRTGTPFTSLVLSFAILHELTAIVPLVGIYFGARAAGVGDKMSEYLSQTRSDSDSNLNSNSDGSKGADGSYQIFRDRVEQWTREGERRAARVGSRYGILGFEKGHKVTEEDLKALGNRVTTELGNAAFAYMAVKALLPVRIVLSVYLSPAFSRRFIGPVTSGMSRLFKRP